MSQTYTLDLVQIAPARPALGGAAAGFAHSLNAPRIGRSRAAGRGATFAKLAFANLIGLAFVLVLPFAGLVALCWFAAKASLNPAA